MREIGKVLGSVGGNREFVPFALLTLARSHSTVAHHGASATTLQGQVV